MMLENVAEWFDWVDAGAEDVELSIRLEALNNIVKRLALLDEARLGWLSKTYRNRRKMAHLWFKIHDFLAMALERSKSPHLTEIERTRLLWYIEDSLYRGRQVIYYLLPECVMLVVPEKLSLEEQLEEDDVII